MNLTDLHPFLNPRKHKRPETEKLHSGEAIKENHLDPTNTARMSCTQETTSSINSSTRRDDGLDPELATGTGPQHKGLIEDDDARTFRSKTLAEAKAKELLKQQQKEGSLGEPQVMSTRSTLFCSSLAKLSPESFNLLISCSILFVLLGIAIAMIIAFQRAREDELEQEAVLLAQETGAFFSDELDRAILPLFSLAQFVAELSIFRELPNRIGQIGIDEDALPMLEGRYHRNVTNVCDDPTLLERFNQIAATIKSQSNMDGILVNLQLAPDAVVCLVHPLNNTEDFEDGVYMDNSGAVGHDLLEDPNRKFIAKATIPSDRVVVAGPLRMEQCADGCHPIVEEAFIARLPIALPDHNVTMDGEVYQRWGFAVAILNWKALIDRSGIYQMFEGTQSKKRERHFDFENGTMRHHTSSPSVSYSGWEFQLTRTDRIVNTDEGTWIENVRSIIFLLINGYCMLWFHSSHFF